MDNKDIPNIVPSEDELKMWATSEWAEYQVWLFHHGYVSPGEWADQRQRSLEWSNPPLISVVTPVYNTDFIHLKECIYSIQAQSYANWELCMVDDASSTGEIALYIKTCSADDLRIKLTVLPENKGICYATNTAIEMATGDYVAFLDHDDRISPDALYHVAEAIRNQDKADIIYSDRDMICPRGFRYMHLFKPDWSPETLFTFNYTCHLTVYRRSLLNGLEGVHADCEGSQDHDLILRAAEQNPMVVHIPRILYHWRQHAESVSMNRNTKTYIYEAVIKALESALERRGLEGEVFEISDLWRGNFNVRMNNPPEEESKLISMEHLRRKEDQYTKVLSEKIESCTDSDYIIVLGAELDPENEAAFQELLGWFQIPEVGFVTGRVLDEQNRFLHAGIVHRQNGIPLSIYEGFGEENQGYMGATSILRNVSAPHPFCFAVRRRLWNDLGGLNEEYTGPHSVFDLALRALDAGSRIVYNPFARFKCSGRWVRLEELPKDDALLFSQNWSDWLDKGDPYYNRNLTQNVIDMGLDLNLPKNKWG